MLVLTKAAIATILPMLPVWNIIPRKSEFGPSACSASRRHRLIAQTALTHSVIQHFNGYYAPKIIPSSNIPKPTDRTDCRVKVMWAELRKSWKCDTRQQNCEYCPIMSSDFVRITSWDCQEGNRACTPKFPSNSIHMISLRIHPKKSVFPPLWGRDCCSSSKWNPVELIVSMHQLCSTTPTQ